MNDQQIEANDCKWYALLIALLSSQWLDLGSANRPSFDDYVRQQAQKTIDLMRYAGHDNKSIEWTGNQFDEAVKAWEHRTYE